MAGASAQWPDTEDTSFALLGEFGQVPTPL